MRKQQIIEEYANGKLATVHILPNPTQPQQWILLFKGRQGHSHFLLSEAEEIESFPSLETALDVLRAVGLKRAEITF